MFEPTRTWTCVAEQQPPRPGVERAHTASPSSLSLEHSCRSIKSMPSSVPTQTSSTSTRAHERPLGCTRHDACTHGRTRASERAREHGNAPVSGWAATCAAWAGSVTGAAAMPKLRSPGGRSRDRNASSDRVALALACASGCKAPTCAALRVSASVRPPSHSAGVRDRGAEPTASPASHASLVMPPLSSRPWRRPRTCTRAHQARDT